ncbi:MAG TPA: GldM family protein [Flavipsychrobacter sp.]|nr:GldM family protein [Flavipsychrobacter sp.]
MKKVLLFTLAIASGKLPALGQHFTISNSHMNIAYVAVENELSVAVESISADSVSLTNDFNPEWIKKGEKRGVFLFRPEKPGIYRIDVVAKKKGKVAKVGSMNYRMKYPPLPVGRLGGRQKGQIGLEKLQKQIGPIIALENFDYELAYKTVSYNFEVRRKGQSIIKHKNSGGAFEAPIQNYLKNAVVGDSLIISDMEVKAARNELLNGLTTINNDSMVFVVVESSKDPYVKVDEDGEE